MSAFAVSVQWKFQEKAQPHHQNSGKKRGILLAFPPNGTTDKQQEQPEQDIGGNWENIKRLHKKTKLGLWIRDIITQLQPLLLMPT